MPLRYMKSASLMGFGTALAGVGLFSLTALAQSTPAFTGMIDDGESNARGSGTWYSFPLEGMNGDFSFAPSKSMNKKRDALYEWRFGNLQPGSYDVYATWTPYAGLASNAKYAVTNGRTTLVSGLVDQRQAPDDVEAEDASWRKILTVDVPAYPVDKKGKAKVQKYDIRVTLSNDADGYVQADAIRMVTADDGGGDEQNATLKVVPQNLPYTDTAVKNQKNVLLYRMRALAQGEDVFLYELTLKSVAGSAQNATNYSLWTDTNGDAVVDAIIQGGAQTTNDRITFNGNGHVIPKDATTYFEVHADIVSSLVNDSLQIALAAEDPAFIKAKNNANAMELATIGFDGDTKEITVYNAATAGPKYTLANQGNLYVTKDVAPLRSRLLLGGALGEPVLNLKLRAEIEDVDVTDLQFTSNGGTATSVDRLELYKAGATTPFATATIGGCGSDTVPTTDQAGNPAQTFCSNTESRQLVVEKGADVFISVRPRMKTDNAGGVSGQNIAFFINPAAVSNNTTGEGAVRARGAISSNNLEANNSDGARTGEIFIGTESANTPNVAIVGQKNTSVLAKFVSITNANPDADNTAVPTGTSQIAQFRFTAGVNSNTLNGLNQAELQSVIFNVSSSGVSFDPASFKLYNKADTSTKAACVTLDTAGNPAAVTSGNVLVRCDVNGTAVNSAVSSGESMTLSLETNVTDAGLGGANLQVSLQQFSDITQNSFGTSASHLQWADKDINSTTFLWTESDNTIVKSTLYRN